MLLNVPGDRGDHDDFASVRKGIVLDEKTATADGGARAVRKGKWLPAGRGLSEDMRDGNHILVGDRAHMLRGPQLHTGCFGEACLVNSRIIDGSAYCAATGVVVEIE